MTDPHPGDPAEDAPRLHRLFPALARSTPYARLGTTPTAVARVPGLDVGGAELWVKDEGAYGDGGWGGNKVRKLEWILPDARRHGCRTVLTFGALGTNHGLATALYARDGGLRAAVAVVDQPRDAHVDRQFALLCGSGASVHRTRTRGRTIASLPWLIVRHSSLWPPRPPYVLPAGGSSPVGVLGMVECALEIAEQVRRGTLPAPTRIVCAVGTGGTAAGLLLGLRLAGLEATVHAAVVNDALRLDEAVIRRLAARTARLLRRRGAALPGDVLEAWPGDLLVDRGALGPGYGVATPEGDQALEDAAACGVALDPVYTAKALAALRADPADGPVLLLRTHGPRG